MLILSSPLVADPLARLFAAVSPTTPSAALRFPEIVCRTTAAPIPTRHGPVKAMIYHPPQESGATPPAYVNVHGGGFVVGHAEQDDPWCRYLAARAKTVVINTDYSLAPQQHFPVAVEQIYDVLRWAAAPEREWDGGRLCVGGQSAGGNLSAAAARLSLENAGPHLKLQVLHYAPLDLVTRSQGQERPRRPKGPVRPWMGEILNTAYIPDPNRRRDRLASPAWGTNGDDIKGIAPALVITAELDRLRDEAASYADNSKPGSLVVYHAAPESTMDTTSSAIRAPTRQMYDFIAEHVGDATAKR